LPMHLTGLLGMPRRVYTYNAYPGWGMLNLLISVGSFVFAIGVSIFLVNVAKSLRVGARTTQNPWDAPTLEWSVPSPPPPYNFAVIPTVASRHPLWESRLGENTALSTVDRGMLLDSGKETIATSALDAAPDMILEMPQDSFAPLVLTAALSVLFVGLLLKTWSVVALGAVLSAAGVLMWLWPRRALREREPATEAARG
jgi:hypothetical protein